VLVTAPPPATGILCPVRGSRLLAAALVLGLSIPIGGPVWAESSLVLPMPESFGSVPAATYDEDGHRVGDARLALEQLANGQVRMTAESGIEGAERNVVSAVLRPVGVNGQRSLQLVSQSSRSYEADGRSLGQLVVDHRDAVGRCVPPPDEGGSVETVNLPPDERVANVPVNLLFLPLAKGESEKVRFQIMLCSGGPRLVDATAEVARRVRTADGPRDIVEIRYEMDFGPLLSRLARPFLPRVAVWFDADEPESWLAHRMPLYAKGPTVMVVRTGVQPGALEEN